jgi:hypothetical protein
MLSGARRGARRLWFCRGSSMIMSDCQWCDSTGTVFRGRCYHCGTRFTAYQGPPVVRVLPLPHPGSDLPARRRPRPDLFTEQLARAAVAGR